MKAHKMVSVFLVCGLVYLCCSSAAVAGVRVIVRPWFPRAVVIAPPRVPPAGPPPPQAPVKVGYVDVNVLPREAYVYADGAYRGRAFELSGPSFLALKPGPHTVDLRSAGYGPQSFRIHVRPQRIMELAVTLKPLPPETPEPAEPEATYEVDLEKTGSLVLNVVPADAAVYVNGSFYGVASQFGENEGSMVLREGTYKVEVAKPGYETRVETVTIASDAQSVLDVNLKKP